MIVARLTEKGGAGKTIPATNLAGMRAMRSRRVLLVDADRQGSLYFWAEAQAGLPLMRVESEVIHGEALGRRLRNPGTRYDDIIVDTGAGDSIEMEASHVSSDPHRRRRSVPTSCETSPREPRILPHVASTAMAWADKLAQLDVEVSKDDADSNGAGRIRKTVTHRRRKPTSLQTAKWRAVRKAKRKGLSIRGIARELGIHRNTVRKYMGAESPPMARGRSTSTVS